MCPNLTTLRLAGCRIQTPHASIVAELIDESLTLRSLDLSFNLLRGDGAEILADSLSDNTTLYFLFLLQ
jgi:Leucine-rich repeat (LRR) protein